MAVECLVVPEVVDLEISEPDAVMEEVDLEEVEEVVRLAAYS